jgi:uncharacterized membrane protein YeaQ/YmgE (transglycosylase-associated protein family)
MKRILSFVFFLGIGLFVRGPLRRLLFDTKASRADVDGATTVADAAQAAPVHHGWLVMKFAAMFQNMTGAELTSKELSLLSMGLMVYCAVFGRVSSLVLGAHGFGAFFNGLIGLLGAAAGMALFSLVAPAHLADGLGWMAGVVIAASFLCLGLAAALKAFVMTEADTFMRGGETRVGTVARSLSSSRPDARAPSAERIQAALARRR